MLLRRPRQPFEQPERRGVQGAAGFVERRRFSRIFAAPELDCELPREVLDGLLKEIGIDKRSQIKAPPELVARLEHEVETCRRWQRPLGFLLARVDRLGEIESAVGAEAAEELVERLGERIWCSVRATDTVGRWSLHELGIILPDAFADGVLAVTRRLTGILVREPLALDDEDDSSSAPPIGVSFGGAAWCSQMSCAEDLWGRAREALSGGLHPGPEPASAF
jgi:diguanylate cyclase (GGDEF)-like protein